MIDKLDLDNGFSTVDWLPYHHGDRSGAKEIQTVVNQLVDAVNYHQKWLGDIQCHIDTQPTENPTISKMENVDPYAEQRKWVGKICRFWNDDESLEDSTYGELVNIFDAPHEDCPFQCGYGEWYEHCEPVKPDDDIIFKGE